MSHDQTSSPGLAVLRLMRGVDAVSDAAKLTLGPKQTSETAMRNRAPASAPKGLHDCLDFPDRVANLGARLIQQAARDARRESGDGTATAVVLAHSILSSATRSVQLGWNVDDVRRGVEQAIGLVDRHVREQAKVLRWPEDALDVARTASHGDDDIAERIIRAIDLVGVNGAIAAEVATCDENLEPVVLTYGTELGGGFVSSHLCTDVSRMICEYEDPLVLIYETLESAGDLAPAFKYAAESMQPVLIIAAHVTPDVIRSLVMNRLRGVGRLALLRLSGAGQERAERLEDLSILTGATIIRAGSRAMHSCEIADRVGALRRFVQCSNRSILLSAPEQERAIQQQVGFMHDTMRVCGHAKQREQLEARLERLGERAALISLNMSANASERLRRFNDALSAVRAALAEGIVAGGGIALLRASEQLPARTVYRSGVEAGIDAVRQALEIPVRQLCENAGVQGSPVISILRSRSGVDVGFDVRTRKCVHMYAAGIVDAARVVRIALTCAGAVATLLLAAGSVVDESATWR